MSAIIQFFIDMLTVFSIVFILLTFVLQFSYQAIITLRKLLHWNLIQLMRLLGFCWVMTLVGVLLLLISFLLDKDLKGKNGFKNFD